MRNRLIRLGVVAAAAALIAPVAGYRAQAGEKLPQRPLPADYVEGFGEGKVLAFHYPAPYVCLPAPSSDLDGPRDRRSRAVAASPAQSHHRGNELAERVVAHRRRERLRPSDLSRPERLLSGGPSTMPHVHRGYAGRSTTQTRRSVHAVQPVLPL